MAARPHKVATIAAHLANKDEPDWFIATCLNTGKCSHRVPIRWAEMLAFAAPETTIPVLNRRMRCSRCGHRPSATALPSWGGLTLGHDRFPGRKDNQGPFDAATLEGVRRFRKPRTYRELLECVRRMPRGDVRFMIGAEGPWALHWEEARRREDAESRGRQAQVTAASGPLRLAAMCGKFSADYTWAEIFAFSQPLTHPAASGDDGGGGEAGAGAEGGQRRTVEYRVNGLLPVIVWDAEARSRRIVLMRWGFPSPKDWRRPQPIHARSESIDERQAFREAFLSGQRGIVVFKTFNEGEEIPTAGGKTRTQQWTLDPLDGQPRGFAFLWRRFQIPDLPAPMLACVMVTVPANELIRTRIVKDDPDPRMPAILTPEWEDGGLDWRTWLGEDGATPEQARAVLRTVEGVDWQAAPEPKRPRPKGKP